MAKVKEGEKITPVTEMEKRKTNLALFEAFKSSKLLAIQVKGGSNPWGVLQNLVKSKTLIPGQRYLVTFYSITPKFTKARLKDFSDNDETCKKFIESNLAVKNEQGSWELKITPNNIDVYEKVLLEIGQINANGLTQKKENGNFWCYNEIRVTMNEYEGGRKAFPIISDITFDNSLVVLARLIESKYTPVNSKRKLKSYSFTN